MPLNLKQLEAFVWAADLGSFSKAAERLNTTQPNISVRIRSLETALKQTLLERDAGSVRLTAGGRELLAHARNVLNAAEVMLTSTGIPELRTGTLRLGVTELIVHTWLQDLLKGVRETFPNLRVEMTIDLSVNLTQDLFDRNIDLALQNGPFDRVISGGGMLDTYSLIWVASPQLDLPTENDVSAEQLSNHPILTHARDSPLFRQVNEHFANSSAQHAHLVPSSNLSACLFMAINSMGIATLPRLMVLDALNRGDIVELRYPWVPEPLEFQARFDASKSPLFVTEIAELAQQVASQYRSVHAPIRKGSNI